MLVSVNSTLVKVRTLVSCARMMATSQRLVGKIKYSPPKPLVLNVTSETLVVMTVVPTGAQGEFEAATLVVSMVTGTEIRGGGITLRGCSLHPFGPNVNVITLPTVWM